MYPDDPLGVRIRIAPGADLTAMPATYLWEDITEDWHAPDPVPIRKGRGDEQGQTQSALGLTLKNHSTDARPNRDGRYTYDNPLSDLYGLWDLGVPIEVSVDPDGTGWRQRAVMYLSSIEPYWPANSAHLALVRVEAAGLLRRLQQGKAIKSALRRTILAALPAGYWPMEDGADSQLVGSAVPGVAAMSVQGTANFASTTGPPGSDPLCDGLLADDGTFGVPGGVISGVTDYQLSFVFRAGATSGAAGVVASWTDPTSVTERFWTITVDSIEGQQVSVNVDDVGNMLGSTIAASDAGTVTFGEYYHCVFRQKADGTRKLYVNNVDYGGTAGASGPPHDMQITPSRADLIAPQGEISFGHFAIWADSTTDVPSHYNAMLAYPGELAHERMARLCDEEAVPFSSDATTSAAMGPQPVDALVPLLRECESTDHGFVDDSLGYIGYVSLRELCNQDVALSIDGAARELIGQFQPVRNDQAVANDVEAGRPGGSSVRVEDAASVAKIGRYDRPMPVNVADDADLANQAGFAVGAGTARGMRYPPLTVDLLRCPHLIGPWLALGLGGRLQLQNPPRQHGPVTVDLAALGWVETITGRRKGWTGVVNASPYSPYEVFQVEGTDNRGRVPAGANSLDAEYAPGDTSLSVTSARTRWIDSAGFPAQFPFLVVIAGEVIRVNSITGTGLTQTFAVTRAAQGGASKRLPAGSTVQLYRAPVIAL